MSITAEVMVYIVVRGSDGGGGDGGVREEGE